MDNKITDLDIAPLDGYNLRATLFEPSPLLSPVPVVIVNSAMAVRRSFYRDFSDFLCSKGFAVVTYDYRGIGDSRPEALVGFKARLSDWAELDYAGVIDWAAARYPGSRLFTVGHSTGGGIVGLAGNAAALHGLVLVSAQSAYWRLWPAPRRYRLAFTFYFLVPAIAAAFGYIPGRFGLGQDLPRGVALEWASWCRRPGYMAGGPDGGRAEQYNRIGAPVLAYSFADDPFASLASVERLLLLFGGDRIVHRHIDRDRIRLAGPVGHFGFFKKENRGRFWNDAADWLVKEAEG